MPVSLIEGTYSSSLPSTKPLTITRQNNPLKQGPSYLNLSFLRKFCRPFSTSLSPQRVALYPIAWWRLLSPYARCSAALENSIIRDRLARQGAGTVHLAMLPAVEDLCEFGRKAQEQSPRPRVINCASDATKPLRAPSRV